MPSPLRAPIPAFLAAILSLVACGGGEPVAEVPAAAGPSASAPAPLSETIPVASSAAPAAPAKLRPIAADPPPDLDATFLPAVPVCASVGGSCVQKELYPAGTLADPNAPAALWTQEFSQAAASLSLPSDVEVDYYGVVVKGSVLLEDKPGTRGQLVPTWTAFHVPAGGFFLVANEAGARVALAVSTGGPPLREAAAKLAGKDGKKLAFTTRPAAVSTVDLLKSQDLAWGGGAMHARIAYDAPDGRAAFELLIASEDAPVAEHQHDTSWEILGAMRADGTLKRASGPGAPVQAEIPVTDGVVSAIPTGTRHAWVPGGRKPLIAVQLYVPPGPEQRFKALAGTGK